ncbi:MAG: alanine:cation symporter family protein, partial [Oleispira sp.]|nr:alanine:cation symporter family protein [Oleispira sp.]
VELTQLALHEHIGQAGKYFIAIAILCFAFTSIVANYSYAENSMVHFGLDSKVGMTCLRLFVMGMVVWGSVQSVSTVFNAADAAMGLMATINLFAILLLSNTVHKLTKDYFASRKAGQEPDFKAENFPELRNKIDGQIWK